MRRRVVVVSMLGVIVLLTAAASSQVAVIGQPGTIIGSVELIVNDVANLTDVNIFTVPMVPAGVRFKITDLIIANKNASASCCARVFSGPGQGTPRTGFISVQAGASVDHSFLNGINFNSGQVVTVRNGGTSGNLDFTVRGYLFTISGSPPPPPTTISSVSVSGSAPTIGGTAQFTATATLSNGTTQDVTALATWSSSNTAVATVNSVGLVRGIAAGETDITATYGAVSGKAHISVPPEPGPPLSLRFNFNGIDDEFDPGSPDLAIAVGNVSMVLVRNQQIVIRDKVGALVASLGLSMFFNSVRQPDEGITDPNVLYDRASNRFFVVTAGLIPNPGCTPGNCVSHYLLAVSRTSNPTTLGSSEWYFFSLDRTRDNDIFTTNWGDFDHFSVTDDALVITSSMYRMQDGSSQGIKVRIIDKAKLIRGEPITTWIDLRDDALGRRLGRLLPAVQFPPSQSVFLVSTTSSCGFVLWRVTDLLSTPALSTKVVEDGGNCESPPDAVQPGGGQVLDVAGVGFNSQPVYRNGRVWVANTISRNLGSGPVAAIYVAEIDVSQWPDSVRTIRSWTIGEDGVWSFAPAIMVDSSNNVGIVYARSSTTEFASAYYSGRLATDPSNALPAVRLLKAGVSVVSRIENGRNRFTDYFGSASDPADDTIWILGMYAKTPGSSGGWVGNMKLIN